MKRCESFNYLWICVLVGLFVYNRESFGAYYYLDLTVFCLVPDFFTVSLKETSL